jgi:hypothetical protein
MSVTGIAAYAGSGFGGVGSGGVGIAVIAMPVRSHKRTLTGGSEPE